MHFLLEWSHVLLPPEVLQASLAKVKISPQSKISVWVTGNCRQLADYARLWNHITHFIWVLVRCYISMRKDEHFSM